MFKFLAGLLNPAQASLSLIKSYQATDINKIRLHHGPILDMADRVEGLAFFMLPDLSWEGGLNRSIAAAAGPKLDEYVLAHATNPKPGEVFLLPSFNMKFKALFMGIINEWDGGVDFEDRDLINCYRDTVKLAEGHGITSLVFPALGRDKRDFPHIKFARLAIQGITQGLYDSPAIQSVTIACADQLMTNTFRNRLKQHGWKGQVV